MHFSKLIAISLDDEKKFNTFSSNISSYTPLDRKLRWFYDYSLAVLKAKRKSVVEAEDLFGKYAESGRFNDNNHLKMLQKLVEEGETPEFTGKAIVALATDRNLLKKTGRIWTTADLGIDYGFRDVNGRQPDSIRGLKYVLGQVGLSHIGALFPLWFRIPGWLMTAVMSRL
ncbi:unnamed protein product [Thelazia callipaeda]|uniref:Peroxidase n=1 Tax=Thelazia callipaeda TaxID=103827 RepID=A0A0N5D532_THECL|nr:unnamed protein product [Thelazia callipaeda]